MEINCGFVQVYSERSFHDRLRVYPLQQKLSGRFVQEFLLFLNRSLEIAQFARYWLCLK